MNRPPTKLFAAILLFVAVGSLSLANAQGFSVLHKFESKSGDPCDPSESGIIAQGRDGNLYSTALCGANGDGAVFRVTPEGKLTVIYSFDGTHGSYPRGGLTLSTDGDFYGTTAGGGTYDCGTVFKITPTGKLTVLYSFSETTDGGGPSAPPIQGSDGNFYGTTSGCYPNLGTVYKMTPGGKLTTLHQFGFTDGAYPYAPLIQAKDGSFYGTTASGGTNAWGVVFKIKPAGNFTVLHNFSDGTDGGGPYGPLIQAADGNFYGTAIAGGAVGFGVIFQLAATGTLTTLHSLNGTSDGDNPYAGLVQVANGEFYGVAAGGGNSPNCQGGQPGCGTIFKISSKGAYSVLHNFNFTSGAYPSVTLAQNTNGMFYGDTWGGGISKPACSQSSGCAVFYSFDAKLPAFITPLPYSDKVGKTVEILGQGFEGTTAVSFNGTAAKFNVVSDTYLTAIVPRGATSGFVTVATPNSKLQSSKKFRVIP
jgi:uncharacterized repeat protein (TIGR03803 family)